MRIGRAMNELYVPRMDEDISLLCRDASILARQTLGHVELQTCFNKLAFPGKFLAAPHTTGRQVCSVRAADVPGHAAFYGKVKSERLALPGYITRRATKLCIVAHRENPPWAPRRTQQCCHSCLDSPSISCLKRTVFVYTSASSTT